MKVIIQKEELRCEHHPGSSAIPCVVCGKHICSICGHNPVIGGLVFRYCDDAHSWQEARLAIAKQLGLVLEGETITKLQ